MPWRCPACEVAIRTNDFELAPRPGARYRCPHCRIELTLDEKTNRLRLAPLEVASDSLTKGPRNKRNRGR